MVGFTMIIPDIQTRAEKLGAPGWLIGAVLASMFIVQSVASPKWGALSDRVGRKPVFIACQTISVASMVVYAVGGNIWLILVSRVLAGLGAANVAVAQAGMTTGLQGEDRTVVLGRLSAAMNVGLILGPVVGGQVAYYLGSAKVGWIGACVSLLGIVLVSLFTKLPQGTNKASKQSTSLKEVVKRFPGLVPLVALSAVTWFSLAMLEGTFGRLLKHQWGYGENVFGFIFAFESAVGLATQGLLLAHIAKRTHPNPRLVLSLLAMGVGLGLTPFAPNIGGLFLLSAVYAVGASVANPTIASLASQTAGDDDQGQIFGAMQSARSLGFVIGPALGGAYFDVWVPGPYVIAGVVCLVAAIGAPMATRHLRKPQE